VLIADYLVQDLDDTLARLSSQVLDLVPPQRQLEPLPGSNSIAWALYHTARHAQLALHVLGRSPAVPQDVEGLDARAWTGGAGLQEVQQEWFTPSDASALREYHAEVFAHVRDFLGTLEPDGLNAPTDAAGALAEAEVDREVFGWLYGMWDQPVAFLVRWPLTGHLVHHVGEMVTYRNQIGLSPFR